MTRISMGCCWVGWGVMVGVCGDWGLSMIIGLKPSFGAIWREKEPIEATRFLGWGVEWGCCFDLAAMDELRVQAYLALIQALLDCPGGEENEILNGHQELLDEGFVQVRQQGES